MAKKVIAIDLDDVIVNSSHAVVDHYNATYGTKLDYKDAYSRDLALWGVDDDKTAIDRVHAFHMSPAYLDLAPEAETIAAIKQLAAQHELHIVTGRSDHLKDGTLRMLKRHFPGVFASVEFTNMYGPTARSKADVCKQLGADLLIDDHLHHAEGVAKAGITVFLFGDYPWNQCQGSLPDRIVRAAGWQDILRLVDQDQVQDHNT